LKGLLPESTTFVIEAITAVQGIHDQLQPRRSRGRINCGGTGIAWSNGAAMGLKMGAGQRRSTVNSLSCVQRHLATIWIRRKCKIPILTWCRTKGVERIAVNVCHTVNFSEGWKAPRISRASVFW
ncbi:hypothetical protein GQ43DRAFT_498013, partial [Delitschia confertaspora ATCC 74209]